MILSGKIEHCWKLSYLWNFQLSVPIEVPLRRPKDGAKQHSASSADTVRLKIIIVFSQNGKHTRMVMFVPSDTNNRLAIPADC